MTFIVWDILVPGRLTKRRKAFKILDQAVDETLTQFNLALGPPGQVGLLETQFRELVAVMRAKLAPYNSKFSGDDIVNAIRDRGYPLKAPEIQVVAPKPKKKVSVWFVLAAAAAALLLAKGKLGKEAKR